MKDGWDVLSLRNCCDILDSKRVPITKSKREKGDVPYYGATGLQDYVKDFLFDEPLVLLGEDGAKWGAGENSAYKIDGKSWVNNHAHVLRPKRDLLKDEWLIYFLNYSDLQGYITGVTVPKLNQEKMGTIGIPVPSLSDQQSIVEYLDSSFAKIDAMKANAEKALNEAKALFQSSLKSLLERNNWEYVDFKDIFPVKMGKTPPRGDKASWDVNKETQNKWVSIADISSNEGKVIQDTKEYISDSAAKKIFKVAKGSLLMSFKLSIGRMAFAGDDLYTNEAIIAIPESDKYHLRFLFYYLSSYDWLSLTEGNEKVKGATLNKTSIGTIQLPVLSLAQQQTIVDPLDAIKAKVDQLQTNYDKISQECDTLKQSILKQVFE